jgi:acyl-homoserine lactone acylase PvdQ
VNLYVQLGRGPDYAWSATSAGQDNTDTFAVDLCEPGGGKATVNSLGYRYKGKCRAMEKLARDNTWAPSAADQTPPGSEHLVAYRTALGIVAARALIRGKPVAYTVLRSTYMHEVDSARGFIDFNTPKRMGTPRAFKRSAAKIGYTFNWLYVNNRRNAYFNSGANPVRSPRIDPNFPVRARGRFLWRGWNASRFTARYTAARRHPQVVDQSYITSWNNKQARGTRASDEQWGYSSVYRVQPLSDRIRRATRGRRKMRLVDLINAMEDAGTVDLRADKPLRIALRVLGRPRDAALRGAVARLRAWVRAGAHRRDRDNNGTYEHAAAIRILDAWWPRWIYSEFGRHLGKSLYAETRKVIPLDNAPHNHGDHLGSAYQDGWYGYASKDLRTVLGRRVRGRYSTVYCGRGSLKRCRKALRASLRRALAHDSAAQLYRGDSVCVDAGRDGDQKCWDAVRMRPLGAVSQPLIDWINRPTFQQAVEVRGRR